jgi:ABC-type sugar transport system ATPase subunit
MPREAIMHYCCGINLTILGYGETIIIDNLEIEIPKGEITVFIGGNGCGKSTLLRIVAGLIKPTDGEVFYRGQLVTGPVKGLSMVFQNFALMPWLRRHCFDSLISYEVSFFDV